MFVLGALVWVLVTAFAAMFGEPHIVPQCPRKLSKTEIFCS